jgi:hypothetical protein
LFRSVTVTLFLCLASLIFQDYFDGLVTRQAVVLSLALSVRGAGYHRAP